MHGVRSHQGQGPHLWLIAGTGEGPPLARALLTAGWHVQVSVVSAAATRAYGPHPRLQLEVGALAGAAGVSAMIEAARRREMPFRWVLDASHPFAQQVSAHLREGCRRSAQPLLRLARPQPAEGEAPAVQHLAQLQQLAAGPGQALAGQRLLLAIGARRLAEAVALTPGALHHARVLPRPAALRQALAAGLPPERLAVLQPGLCSDGAIERALCRQWRIQVVLCRGSGGLTEALWRQLGHHLGLQLLLLQRPREDPSTETLPLAALLERVGHANAAWAAGSMATCIDRSARDV